MTNAEPDIDQSAIDETVDWLITARQFKGPRQVLDELCTRLVGAGVDIYRAAVFIRTLHPSIMGRRFSWTKGEGVQVIEASYALLDSELFQQSTIGHVYRHGQPVRIHLDGPDADSSYNTSDELRKEGASDYLMLPMFFSNGEVHGISWATRQPGGFLADELAAFDAVTPAFARATEIYALRRTGVTFLDTYVGHGAGARILSGSVQRGDVQEIDAVILAADLRGFSRYTSHHDGAEVVARLNAFFERLVAPITEQGGEVLKFTGDGLLAIFPYEAEVDLKQRCHDALTAAQAAQASIATDLDEADIDEIIKCGIALHPGRVLFGNVGTESRLDFTAIGAAVNMAARLETVAGEQGEDIVVSSDFVAAEEGAYGSLGQFSLKGFEGEREVFKPL